MLTDRISSRNRFSCICVTWKMVMCKTKCTWGLEKQPDNYIVVERGNDDGR